MQRNTLHPNDRTRVVMLPRTLPVRTVDDLSRHHFVISESGRYSLRRGAPAASVAAAARALLDGEGDLNGFLDSIGVPRLADG